ncbi:MAG: hypothetical protein RL651_907 [Pseudomonadota bacterium]|jgi:hypothetical protein
MTTVFIAGSMQIKKLDGNVRLRIDNIISSGFDVVVGDAEGVDYSIQRYLYERKFNSVVVFCSGSEPRNNVGQWNIREVKTSHVPGTRPFFTAKDVEMATLADFGFMIWDTKSTGTLSNIFELLSRKKKSLVYVNKAREFFTVSDVSGMENLLAQMTDGARVRAEQKIGITNRINALRYEQGSLIA